MSPRPKRPPPPPSCEVVQQILDRAAAGEPLRGSFLLLPQRFSDLLAQCWLPVGRLVPDLFLKYAWIPHAMLFILFFQTVARLNLAGMVEQIRPRSLAPIPIHKRFSFANGNKFADLFKVFAVVQLSFEAIGFIFRASHSLRVNKICL